MKKVLLFLVAIIFIAGIGYAGYLIFNSKNIVKIEIEGTAQTLYLVDEAVSPDFQDAKLKITYKSGDVKYVEMKNSYLTIHDFSTSIVRHGTMKITYKSQMITLDYDVINSGVYYLSSYTKTMVVGNNSSAGYSINNTRNFYSLQPNGVLKYYNFNTANNKWYLYDGKYISSYKYEVVDDKIKIYLGSSIPTYELKANVVNGAMNVKSTNYHYDNDLQIGKTVYSFTHYEMKTNVSIDSLSLISENNDFLTESGSLHQYLMFKVDDTLTSSDNELYFKLKYTDYLINTNVNGVPVKLLNEVYVVLDDSMVNNNTLQTNIKRSYLSNAEVSYESHIVEFFYKVQD